MGWTPAEPLPATLSLNAVENELAKVRAAATPATFECFSVVMDKLLEWAQVFKIPVEDYERVVALYGQALRHIPSDLLVYGVETAIARQTHSYRLPMSGEILAIVREELQARTRALCLVESVKSKHLRDNSARAEEQRRAVTARIDHDFLTAHGMTYEQAQTEWRRRRGLEGEPKTRDEAVDASRGALSIYARGFEPKDNSFSGEATGAPQGTRGAS